MKREFAGVRAEEDVPGRADPASLLAAVKAARKSGGLDDAAQRVIEASLAEWTLAAIEREDDIDGVIELGELAELAVNTLPKTVDVFRARWQAYADLLESKRLALRSASSGRAMHLLHAPQILKLLKTGERPQSELRSALGVSAARLSQVLAVMEEGRLIRRKKQGKENLVSLHAKAEKPRSIGALVWGGGT